MRLVRLLVFVVIALLLVSILLLNIVVVVLLKLHLRLPLPAIQLPITRLTIHIRQTSITVPIRLYKRLLARLRHHVLFFPLLFHYSRHPDYPRKVHPRLPLLLELDVLRGRLILYSVTGWRQKLRVLRRVHAQTQSTFVHSVFDTEAVVCGAIALLVLAA